MATITLTQEMGEQRRRSLRSIIRSLLAYIFPRMSDNPVSSTRDEITAFKKAMRTIRMAAEAGEDYERVAARIESEATKYKAFLLNPQPIGKIALRIKQLNSEDADYGAPHEQYRVNDPSEGQRDPEEGKALVSYTLNRSDDKVLEFILHGETGEALFPIARTYSTWIGQRAFDLGLDRTFFLEMEECAPGYATVQAGFAPPRAREETGYFGNCNEKQTPLATRVKDRAARAGGGRSPFSPFRLRLFYIVGVECVLVSLVCCSVYWTAFAGSTLTSRAVVARSDNYAALGARLSQDKTSFAWNAPRSVSVGSTAEEIPDGHARAEVGHQEARRLIVKNNDSSAMRWARIRVVNITVDNDSCKEPTNRCRELLTDVQNQVQSTLSRHIPVSAIEHEDLSAHSGRLVVSYRTGEDLHGRIHLALYDHEGALWNGHDLIDQEMGHPQLIGLFSDEASREIVEELQTARDRVHSAAPEPVESVQRGEGM